MKQYVPIIPTEFAIGCCLHVSKIGSCEIAPITVGDLSTQAVTDAVSAFLFPDHADQMDEVTY
jgi:hypothetical protein